MSPNDPISTNPNQTVARVPEPPAESVFSVLVPHSPDAQSVTLFSSEHQGQPIGATRMFSTYTLQAAGRFANRPAEMIARFSLEG